MMQLYEVVERAERITKQAIEQALAELGEYADIFDILARAKQIRAELYDKEREQ